MAIQVLDKSPKGNKIEFDIDRSEKGCDVKLAIVDY